MPGGSGRIGARASRRRIRRTAAFCSVALAVSGVAAEAATLRGSRSSLLHQQKVARQHDYTHLRNAAQVRKFVRAGLLVPIRGNADYRLASVSYPYGRPEMKTFLEQTARDYRRACGEPLVVTSLTRPTTRQPRNASPFSVHPTGMAVDLRRSRSGQCQRWLDARLLRLEREGVLDATRENRPPHYHVALFPKNYRQFLADGGLEEGGKTWRVSRGDTLWGIARRYGTSVAAIQRLNGLAGATIRPGQVLRLP